MRCLSGVRRVGCVRRQRSSVAATHAGQTARDCELEFPDPSPAENVEPADFCNKIGQQRTCSDAQIAVSHSPAFMKFLYHRPPCIIDSKSRQTNVCRVLQSLPKKLKGEIVCAQVVSHQQNYGSRSGD